MAILSCHIPIWKRRRANRMKTNEQWIGKKFAMTKKQTKRIERAYQTTECERPKCWWAAVFQRG